MQKYIIPCNIKHHITIAISVQEAGYRAAQFFFRIVQPNIMTVTLIVVNKTLRESSIAHPQLVNG